MPPGPVFNWLAVAHSALVILDHALQHRAAQVTRVGCIRVSQSKERARSVDEREPEAKDAEELVKPADESHSLGPTHVQPSSLLHANEAWLRQLEIAATPLHSLSETVSSEQRLRGDTAGGSASFEPTTLPTTVEASPPTSDPPIRAADVNLSGMDAPSSQHIPAPESDPPPHDVLPNCHLDHCRI
ncbi:hypothetical protein BJV74DRAFT_262735 [Russula compacta]|nr:hypothetical protein BJV74DRAFT_262735 [Russula compacta]